MHLLSIQIGKARTLADEKRKTRTGIFKNPVLGPVATDGEHLAGDRIADLRVHGGYFQAVYAYPAEHYPFWRADLGREVGFGTFGENLTCEGLVEDEVCSGDVFRIGTAELMATVPRIPCFKLEMKLKQPDMVERFLEARKPGIYFAITRQGVLTPGDEIEVISRCDQGITIVDLMKMHVGAIADKRLLLKASALPSISAGWQDRLKRKADHILRQQ